MGRQVLQMAKETPEQRAAREAAEARDAESRASLERGGLPIRAQERLAQERGPDGRPKIWTSDLSVSELLASRSVDFEPVSQVFGSSVYHMAYQVGQWSYNSTGEITSFSQALYHARSLALGRLLQEATALGAHGVIGVRLEHKEYEWGANLLEFSALGTAVRLRNWQGKLPMPFTSDLSGQEFLKVLHAGYVPVTLAMGCVAYYVFTSWNDEYAKRSWINQEMTGYTQGVYRARHLAFSRLSDDARRVHADGVIGSDIHMKVEEVTAYRYRPYSNESEAIEDYIVEFFAFGTTVAEIKKDHEIVKPRLVVDLEDKPVNIE
jgi:uncharacterized protein YbjQ (UPF0145 family)